MSAQQTLPSTRPAAWVILGISLVVAAYELWVNSPALGTFNFFGLVDGPEEIASYVIFSYAVWLLAGVMDVVFFLVLKGSRNRAIAFGGLVALLVPLVHVFGS